MGWRVWFRRQPERVEVDGELLEGDELVAVVGEASYQEALRRICGSDRWEDVACDCQAVLVPEPTNEYDPNAVAVQIEGQLVGYLSRGDARDYRPLVSRLAGEGRVGVCSARIAGRGPGSETSNLGVFLKMPPS